jgi:hypothetical protein
MKKSKKKKKELMNEAMNKMVAEQMNEGKHESACKRIILPQTSVNHCALWMFNTVLWNAKPLRLRHGCNYKTHCLYT